MKATNIIIFFQTINQGFNSAINIRVNGKMFSFHGILDFCKPFYSLVLKGPSESLVLLVNLVNGILINLILIVSNFLTSQFQIS